MIWWVAGILTIAFAVEWFILRGHVTIGRWACTARDDGTFSKLQTASQIAIVTILALGTLAVMWGFAHH
jgi:hypothetical protein